MSGEHRHRFLVLPADEGARLDRFVHAQLKACGRTATRADVQRWIKQERVSVDGRHPKAASSVRAKQEILVVEGTPPKTEALPDPSVPFEVIYADEYFLVVEKPAGVVVHPAPGHRDKTLVNGLLARGDFDAKNADPRDTEGHLRPGIVHRIDKDTSGLMVVAKRPDTRELLKELFVRHDIERAYLAIVIGNATAATYETQHGRHRGNRLKFTSLFDGPASGTRMACTHVAVEKKLHGSTLVRCTLETGRTHQIRVHLSEQGRTPILADGVYGGSRPRDPIVAEACAVAKRQALHAAVLGFVHPHNGKMMRWESKLPESLQAALVILSGAT